MREKRRGYRKREKEAYSRKINPSRAWSGEGTGINVGGRLRPCKYRAKILYKEEMGSYMENA